MELPTFLPDGWSSVRSTSNYSPWVLVDELLVNSLGLNKFYDTFQSYIQLQLFMLAFVDTSIIDNNIGGDKQWQRTWRVGSKRPPEVSDLIIYNRIRVDHQRQTD
jgi:hypothetical protein